MLSVVENESGNRTIAQIQAFDRDLDYPNNYVQYRLNAALSDSEVNGVFFCCVRWYNMDKFSI